LEELEWELEYDDIRFYRRLAMKELKTIGTTSPSSQPDQKSTWYNWITGTSQPKSTETENWNEQLKKLYDQFDFVEPDAIKTTYPNDFEMIKVTMHLHTASLSLRNYNDSEMVEFLSAIFYNMRVDYIGYPNSFIASFNLEDLKVFDSAQNSSKKTPKELIYAKNIENEIKSDFFVLKYEFRPLDGRADNALTMRMRPLQVFVNPFVLSGLINYFSSGGESSESFNQLQVRYVDAGRCFICIEWNDKSNESRIDLCH
jgi:vacuolar protein sorting-associated protein 13A/C